MVVVDDWNNTDDDKDDGMTDRGIDDGAMEKAVTTLVIATTFIETTVRSNFMVIFSLSLLYDTYPCFQWKIFLIFYSWSILWTASVDEKNPNDLEAKTFAGVEGLLRMYEAVLVKRPELRNAEIDRVIDLRNKGELAAFVKQLPPMPKRP